MKEEDKTLLVRDALFNAILTGKYSIGSRLPTEREVSQEYSVSRVTARRAYGILEEAGILQRNQGKGTFVTDVRWKGNPERIDQVAFLTAIKDPFAMEFLESFQRELDRRDALCILKVTEQNPQVEKQAAIKLVSKGVRNIVIWPSGKFHCDTFARLRILGTNMVFFDRMLPDGYADYIGLDNDDAMKKLVAQAIKDESEKLIMISHSMLEADSDKQREVAFVKYAKQAGIEHEIKYIIWHGNSKQQLEAYKDEWFNIGQNTGIICVNDMAAMAVKSITGNRFKVYGIDGLDEAIASGITTVKQPFAEMAQKAIELLCRQQKLADKWTSKKVIIKGELIIGDKNE